MTLSKTNMLLIAAILGGAFLIEHGNRTRIEAAIPVDSTPITIVACPVNESAPFSAECMAFIQGSTEVTRRRLSAPLSGILPDSPELPGESH